MPDLLYVLGEEQKIIPQPYNTCFLKKNKYVNLQTACDGLSLD